MSVSLILPLGTANTGLTLTAQVYAGSTLAGTPTVTESPVSSGMYAATFAAGNSTRYVWRMIDGTGRSWGSGSFITDAAGAEVDGGAIASIAAAVGDGTHPTDLARKQDVTITGTGATAAQVWAYGDRHLTDPIITTQPTLLMGHRQIIRGDTYGADGRAFLSQASDGGEWPTDLSDFTWTATLTKAPENTQAGTASLVGAVVVVTETGDSRSLSVTLTATQTAAMAPGLYGYAITGVGGGGVVWTPETGGIDAL